MFSSSVTEKENGVDPLPRRSLDPWSTYWPSRKAVEVDDLDGWCKYDLAHLGGDYTQLPEHFRRLIIRTSQLRDGKCTATARVQIKHWREDSNGQVVV